MTAPAAIEQVEFGVTAAYAAEHAWVVPAITGFLSAYYMEDPRFRVARRWAAEDGAQLWLCELHDGMPFQRLIRRLQADIPPCRIIERGAGGGGAKRVLLDLPPAA
jgi:hypothetical protein